MLYVHLITASNAYPQYMCMFLAEKKKEIISMHILSWVPVKTITHGNSEFIALDQRHTQRNIFFISP